MAVTENAAAGITRGVAPYLFLGGLLVTAYLFRDKIAAWLQGLIPTPDLSGFTDPFYNAGKALAEGQQELWKAIQCHLTGDFCPEMTAAEYAAFKAAHPPVVPVASVIDTKGPDNWIKANEDQADLGIGAMTIIGGASSPSYGGTSRNGDSATTPSIDFTQVGPVKDLWRGENQDIGDFWYQGHKFDIIRPASTTGGDPEPIIVDFLGGTALRTGGIYWSAHDIVFPGDHEVDWASQPSRGG